MKYVFKAREQALRGEWKNVVTLIFPEEDITHTVKRFADFLSSLTYAKSTIAYALYEASKEIAEELKINLEDL